MADEITAPAELPDFAYYREIAQTGGRMPFNAAAILVMLDAIDALAADLAAARTKQDEYKALVLASEGVLIDAPALAVGERKRAEQAEADLAATRARLAEVVGTGEALVDKASNAVSALKLAQEQAGKPDPHYMVLDVTRNTREDLERALERYRALAGAEESAGQVTTQHAPG